MNLISVAMFALNVNVDGNSRQARVNGRSDCVGVLCRVVACCAVLCCGVLWMSGEIGRACCLEKCLKQLREAKKT